MTKYLTLRAHEDNGSRFSTQYMPNSIEHRFRLHDHTGPTTEGIVIDLAMFTMGKVPYVPQMYVDYACSPGPSENTGINGPLEHLWKQREDIYSHQLGTSRLLFLQ
jgi:hypothetical protein